MGQFRWMVKRQQVCSGTELDALGAHEGLGDHEVGGGDRFPWGGEMLANPGFLEAQLVDQAQVIQVPLVGFIQSPFRWVGWHHEQSEFHAPSFRCEQAMAVQQGSTDCSPWMSMASYAFLASRSRGCRAVVITWSDGSDRS